MVLPLNWLMVRRRVLDRVKNWLPSASVSGFGWVDVMAWPLEKCGEVVAVEAVVEIVLGILVGRELDDVAVWSSGSDTTESSLVS